MRRKMPVGPNGRVVDAELVDVQSSQESWSQYLLGDGTTVKLKMVVTNSLAQFFVSLLPKDPRIEHVYWFAEDEVLKVWTVIPEPDFSLERPLYEGQMFFMEKFPEYDCDFSVIYRFGKSLDDVKPHGGHPVL